MSIAAALGAVGLAIKGIDEDNRKRAIQDEELANNREDRTMRRQVHELTFSQLTDKAAQEKTARTRLQAYNDLATTATNDEDFLNKKIAKAKELGDGEGMLSARQQLVSYKAENLRKTVDVNLRKFMMTGDPTALTEIYNTQVPDGKKVLVTPIDVPSGASKVTASAFGPSSGVPGASGLMPNTGIAPQAKEPTYRIQMMNASGKVEADSTVTKDQIGMLAHQMMNPKFAEQVFMDSLKDKREINKQNAIAKGKADHDIRTEEAKSRLGIAADNRRADREMDNIEFRGNIDRRNSLASIEASHASAKGLATWKAGIDAYALEKQGAGGTGVKAQDQRVAKSTQIVHDYLKTDAFGGMNPTSQPLYIEAVRNAGQKVRAGADPETAAAEAIKEATAKVKAKATSGASPTIGLPSFK